MLSGLLQAAGGLGLFLLGMSVMTDGLKALADDRLRSILARSTKSPLKGVCTGAVTTAMIQSSSATTVAAVGLVHAGLLTFSQSLGIIFGANIGTTITGWMVALLGFKLKLGEIVLPIILIGALLRLMGRGRLQLAGSAMAGFGLIFVGISVLQQGMAAFEGVLTPESFPPDTWSGRILLVLIGVAITLITQSSSAGVATALAAVNAGTISLTQAAAMVIGMDIGTTVTAVMASIGGNIQARRTGLAHVFYNALTGIIAFALLTPYFAVLEKAFPGIQNANPEIALVSFHTFFNALGVITILPFTQVFAKTIQRLLPDRGNPLAKRLDRSLYQSPDVALQAVTATLQELVQSLLSLLLPTLKQPERPIDSNRLAEIDDAILRSRDYLENLNVDPQREPLFDLYSRAIHILDHLNRVSRRAHDTARLKRVRDDDDLAAMTNRLTDSAEFLRSAKLPVSDEVEAKIRATNQHLKKDMRRYRIKTLQLTAAGELSTTTVLQRMDAARAIRRLGYHIWRIADHASERVDRHV